MSKPRQASVTVWDRPDEVIKDSQWGTLSYRQWCTKETERMNGKGGNVHVNEQGGYVAICRG